MTTCDSSANITALDWPYRDEDTPLTGVLYRDEALAGTRPGILLVHGGTGLNEHARGQARRYAALGYVVFACDMLGDGVAGTGPVSPAAWPRCGMIRRSWSAGRWPGCWCAAVPWTRMCRSAM